LAAVGAAGRGAGFRGRGVLKKGAPADIIVYDFDGLRVLPDEIAHDLPGGEWRRIQRAEGYKIHPRERRDHDAQRPADQHAFGPPAAPLALKVSELLTPRAGPEPARQSPT
jgi:hypothetical protein